MPNAVGKHVQSSAINMWTFTVTWYKFHGKREDNFTYPVEMHSTSFYYV